MKKIAVGLSGGVDSATSLYILKKQGYETVAVFTDFFNCANKSAAASCCSPGGLAGARETASFLGVPFYRMDLKDEFNRLVLEPFIESYNRGLTPNPCILCNSRLRFSIFMDKLEAMGITYLATGHYAALKGEKLYRSADEKKDQSYFLYGVDRRRFRNVLFPLAGLRKTEVRRIALRHNLPAAESKESQDSCILAEKSLKDYLKEKTKLESGDITDSGGKILGRHQGYQNYTRGQGIALGGMKRKLYVRDIIPSENRIVASPKEDIYEREVKFNFNPKMFFASKGQKLHAKLRSTQKPLSCEVKELDLRENICKIEFSREVWAPAPGQSAVLYRNGEVAGGGEILKC